MGPPPGRSQPKSRQCPNEDRREVGEVVELAAYYPGAPSRCLHQHHTRDRLAGPTTRRNRMRWTQPAKPEIDAITRIDRTCWLAGSTRHWPPPISSPGIVAATKTVSPAFILTIVDTPSLLSFGFR
jgi:hypothetical protein